MNACAAHRRAKRGIRVLRIPVFLFCFDNRKIQSYLKMKCLANAEPIVVTTRSVTKSYD